MTKCENAYLLVQSSAAETTLALANKASEMIESGVPMTKTEVNDLSDSTYFQA